MKFIIACTIFALSFAPKIALGQKTYSIKRMESSLEGKELKVTYKTGAIKIVINESANKVSIVDTSSPFDNILKITYATNAEKPNSHIRCYLCITAPSDGSHSVTVYVNQVSRHILFKYIKSNDTLDFTY
ncbi:MAG: hypothetical protein EOP45_21235 [Sphingobacteriaceae bacterium]|nr:MAG: hypothetical protein EOP45_21235 [Sphingobacteriaceae bacterium]